LLNDEVTMMRDAVKYDTAEKPVEHIVQPECRPVVRFYDRMTQSGTCVLFTEFSQYNMESDPSDVACKIFNVAANPSSVMAGELQCIWTPLPGPYAEDTGDIEEIDDPEMLLGKPWTYKFEIRSASGMPINLNETRIEYMWFQGKLVSTETKQYDNGTRTPDYEFSKIHHVPKVTKEFLDFLNTPLELSIHTTPHIVMPPNPISTKDPGVAERIHGDFESSDAQAMGGVRGTVRQHQPGTASNAEVTVLQKELAKVKMEKRLLVARSIVVDIKKGVAAGSGVNAVKELMNGNAESDVAVILRSRVAELEAELVARGPVPPSAPHTGNPRRMNAGLETGRIEELEKELATSKEREQKLMQQIRDLGAVPMD